MTRRLLLLLLLLLLLPAWLLVTAVAGATLSPCLHR
jgi:hypothetical protein